MVMSVLIIKEAPLKEPALNQCLVRQQGIFGQVQISHL
jgi:hypothetical protein